MPKKTFEPNFRTPKEQFSKEENNKLSAWGSSKAAPEAFKQLKDFEKPDIAWEAEQLAKSYGIYLEFNRAKTGSEKDWSYMLRVSNPGGGPINNDQWLAYDELSEKYCADPQGNTSLRFTNRQNIQFHWVKKQGVLDIVRTLAEKGMYTLNGCGDNTRNVMGCPLSRHSDVYNAHTWARRAGEYFQLPMDPYIEVFAIDPKYLRKPQESFQYGPGLLNRKFKIAFSAIHRDPETGELVPDNCVELRTNDLGVAPILEDGKVTRFQIYVGGGQGERNGKPSMAALGLPLATVSEDQLMTTLDAIVQVHQDWGDRQNRFWARLKYVIKAQGVEWYRDQVSQKTGFPLGKPLPDLDYGKRHLHFGWHTQPSNGKWTYGAFIENGRITDAGPNGKIKTMIREVMKKYPLQLMVTPNQDILFADIEEDTKRDFEAHLKKYGYGLRNGKPYSELRLRSGACVGRDTCRLTYTDSEKFEPYLIDDLEKMGWGKMKESIGITGCERQCFRPATKAIGLVGSGLNRYQFKLMGDESGKFQGVPVISEDGEKMYLRSVSREDVRKVIDVLFKFHQAGAKDGEGLGSYHRRIGMQAIIDHLLTNPVTAPLMEKPFNTDTVLT